MLEKIKLNKSTRVTKDTAGDYVLQAVPENMELLMLKINELVGEVTTLQLEVKALKNRPKGNLVCGPRY
jgi:hypothetical protein